MNTTAAIAKHFNVTESAVIRCEEWAHVLSCVVRGIGAGFVSKKVVNKMDKPLPESVTRKISLAQQHEDNPQRFAVIRKELERLALSGRQQLKTVKGANAELIRNGIEAIEVYLAKFNA